MIIIIAIVFLLFFGSGNSTPSNNSTNGQVELPITNSVEQTVTTQPTTSSTNISTSGTTVSVATAGGGTIQTKNFIKDSTTAKDPINSGYYYLGYHVNEGVADTTATSTPPYIIEYIATTQYFNIALLQEPIGPVRVEAEKYLMAHLGISENQMCQLNYMLSVPDSVNSQYSGINLGFSFCPGATVLPN